MGVEIKVEKVKKTDFEAIGLAGEFEPSSGKIEPMYLFIGSTENVRKWLNTFGGLDIFEYVRYDKYAEVLAKVEELEELNEKLRFKLTDKEIEIKALKKKIEELEKRVEELELELAGKEKPVV